MIASEVVSQQTKINPKIQSIAITISLAVFFPAILVGVFALMSYFAVLTATFSQEPVDDFSTVEVSSADVQWTLGGCAAKRPPNR